jgi:hypothetical protein
VAVWSPWRELRDRPHIEFTLGRLPHSTGGAVYWPERGWTAILLDRRLNQTERRCALAHELVHDERGGGVPISGMPDTWRPVAAREEGIVDNEVARRLVPLDQLRLAVDDLADLGMGASPLDVALAFDVTPEVAERALRLLRGY